MADNTPTEHTGIPGVKFIRDFQTIIAAFIFLLGGASFTLTYFATNDRVDELKCLTDAVRYLEIGILKEDILREMKDEYTSEIIGILDTKSHLILEKQNVIALERRKELLDKMVKEINEKLEKTKGEIVANRKKSGSANTCSSKEVTAS